MIYSNFSDLYKKVLINAEVNAQKLWYKRSFWTRCFTGDFKEDTVLLKDLFNLYWVWYDLVLELFLNKDLFPKNLF